MIKALRVWGVLCRYLESAWKVVEFFFLLQTKFKDNWLTEKKNNWLVDQYRYQSLVALLSTISHVVLRGKTWPCWSSPLSNLFISVFIGVGDDTSALTGSNTIQLAFHSQQRWPLLTLSLCGQFKVVTQKRKWTYKCFLMTSSGVTLLLGVMS